MSEDEIILTHILQCRSIDLVVNKPVLTSIQQEQYKDYKARRSEGEPLQYILGSSNFMGLELVVNPSVLIPRPETEQLVDAALKSISKMSSPPTETLGQANALVGDLVHILDLGTGSGNIAIALAKFIPQSKIISIDLSPKALEVARKNAQNHGVEDRVKFIYADMNDYLSSSTNAGFDLIISNPPYVPTEQLSTLPEDVQNEPIRALDGGEDGLDFYRIIIKYTPRLLRSGACLMMEFGDGQLDAIKKLTEAEEVFSNIEIIQDLASRDRIIKAIR